MCGRESTYGRISRMWQAQALEVKARGLRLVGLAERLKTENHLHLPLRVYTKGKQSQHYIELKPCAHDRYGTF
jgi:hypothetical protein